jgi:hypothetical protein
MGLWLNMSLYKPFKALAYTILLLGSISFLYQAYTKPQRHYIGDLSRVPDILSLGEDIYAGFEPKRPYIDREYACFLKAVYIESYNEGIRGQQAVAQVLYNRYVSRDFPEAAPKGPARNRERDENKLHNAYAEMRAVVEAEGLPNFCSICGDEHKNAKHVNHKDRNPWNNDPHNLESLCVKCHHSQHGMEAWAAIQFALAMGLTYMDIHNVARKAIKEGVDLQTEVKSSFEGFRVPPLTTLDPTPEYHSKEWLEEKYVKEGLSTYQVAEAGGCEQKTILRRLERNGIQRRPSAAEVGTHTPRPKARFLSTLNNDEWLKTTWLETFSFSEMSRRCGSSKPAVIKRMKALFKRYPTIPQEAPEGFHPPSPYAQTVQNEAWLKAAWMELGNITHIANRAQCSPGYVHKYITALLKK